MLIVEISPLPNGAHRNQSGNIKTIPKGWASVPGELEAQAISYLPFINLTIVDGQITNVSQGETPPPEELPPPTMTTEEAMLDLLVDLSYRMDLQELGL